MRVTVQTSFVSGHCEQGTRQVMRIRPGNHKGARAGELGPRLAPPLPAALYGPRSLAPRLAKKG